MKSPYELYEQLELYLNDSLSAKDRNTFEEEIRTHPRIAAELASFQVLRRVLRSSGARPTKQSSSAKPSRLTKAASTRPKEPKETETKAPQARPSRQTHKPKSTKGRFVLAAAGIILLFTLAIYAIDTLQAPQENELFALYFQAGDAPEPSKFAETTAQWTVIKHNFDAKKYAAAIPLLEEMSNQPGEEGLKAHYYLGVCYLALDQPATRLAINHLMIADVPQHTDQLQTEWYLGLAYLKSGQAHRASSIFKRINSYSEFNNKQRLGELISDLQ